MKTNKQIFYHSLFCMSWMTMILMGSPSTFMLMAKPPAGLMKVKPETVGINALQLSEIDAVVQEGIKQKKMPGCVVLVGHCGKIVFLKAYGHRQLFPTQKKMTTDTLFDMASLTKPIATATCVMLMIERGLINKEDAVVKYLPEFGKKGKEKITIEQLLTHQSGLLPDNSIRDYQQGSKVAFQRIYNLSLRAKPGEKFIYSDVGFIILAKIVEKVTKKNVHQFSQQSVFVPLGMQETGYLPNAELQIRAAVTEKRSGKWLQGQVHDPRAYYLSGIAGHAGLFSTATDLSRYAQMMLNNGTYQNVQILKSATVKRMTTSVSTTSGKRCLGWDSLSKHSSNRGKNFSKAAFGHGGFTGTSLWIDPEKKLFVIFLSNRLHPHGKGSINRLAGKIGTIAASSLPASKLPASTNPKPFIQQKTD